MRIVLLSGGSGKRLWPLSNDIRAKQFLKVLRNENGKNQSMIQRIYSQLKKIYPNVEITVVTNLLHKDIIQGQLLDDVDILCEPEIRDTFPAVMLSCVYLSMVKNVPDNEVVIVIPVDLYTDIEFFKLLNKLEMILRNYNSNIALIGIEPIIPSTDYGYITIGDKIEENVFEVTNFIEKPDLKEAQDLIKKNSYWNSGVFGLKIGYIKRIANKFLKFDDFEQFYRKYAELKKTSFDYEIIENERSISLVKFSGKWKDIGTWKNLIGEIDMKLTDNVVMENVENTYIINKLNIPVIVAGLKNTIISISPDGILISDIEESNRIKPYVNKLNIERIMYEERRWGEYTIIDNSNFNHTKSITKHLILRATKSLSYQSHEWRKEVWVIIEGEGILVIDNHKQKVSKGDTIHIEANQKHSLKAITELHLIETQIGTRLYEDDIKRYNWVWEN